MGNHSNYAELIKTWTPCQGATGAWEEARCAAEN